MWSFDRVTSVSLYFRHQEVEISELKKAETEMKHVN